MLQTYISPMCKNSTSFRRIVLWLFTTIARRPRFRSTMSSAASARKWLSKCLLWFGICFRSGKDSIVFWPINRFWSIMEGQYLNIRRFRRPSWKVSWSSRRKATTSLLLRYKRAFKASMRTVGASESSNTGWGSQSCPSSMRKGLCWSRIKDS